MAQVTKFLQNLDNAKAIELLKNIKTKSKGELKFNPKNGEVSYDDSNKQLSDLLNSQLTQMGVELGDTSVAAQNDEKKMEENQQTSAMGIFTSQFPNLAKVIENMQLDESVVKSLSNAMYAKLRNDPNWLAAVKKNKDSTDDLQKIIFKLIKVTPELKDTIKVNGDTYSVAQGKDAVKGKIKMPGLFEVEPDDTVWKDPFIVKLGCPMVNFSNPLIKKILSVEDAKEELPKNYKAFKKALKKCPKASNDITPIQALGAYAGIFGKNPAVLLKEMVNSGSDSVPCHRNLLAVPYDAVMNADASNDTTPIKCRVIKKLGDGKTFKAVMKGIGYDAATGISTSLLLGPIAGAIAGTAAGAATAKELNTTMRTSKAAGSVTLTPAGLVAFYAAVDPNDVTAYMRAMNPEDYGASNGANVGEMLKAYIKYLNENGHPPIILLKPSSKINESNTKLSEAGRRGIVMVTSKFDGHDVGMFLNEKEAEKLFAEG